jgi:hypothetical protein
VQRRRRWRSVAWLLAGFVLLVVLVKAQLPYDGKIAPVLQHGTLRQRAVARNFAVTVHGYRLAQSYTVANTQNFNGPAQLTLQTPGVWMSVRVIAEVLDEPGYVSARLLTRDGNYYAANGDSRPHLQGVNLGNMQLIPALPQDGAYFFELPPAQVPGAHIQFYRGLLTPPNMDSLLDVDLDTGRMTPQDVNTATVPNIDLRP